jgi:hypothetical protein
MPKTVYRVCHFTLFGDFDIHEVTRVLSLTPSFTIEKGELLDMSGESVPARTATWDLYASDELTMNEQVEFVLSVLWERAEEVRKLADRFSAYLVLVLTDDVGANTLTLRPEALQKLATMNISLDCNSAGNEVENAD